MQPTFLACLVRLRFYPLRGSNPRHTAWDIFYIYGKSWALFLFSLLKYKIALSEQLIVSVTHYTLHPKLFY
ncbi:hypothetical protein Plhal304r1_c041g0119731 [Plasmopara halstedii]